MNNDDVLAAAILTAAIVKKSEYHSGTDIEREAARIFFRRYNDILNRKSESGHEVTGAHKIAAAAGHK